MNEPRFFSNGSSDPCVKDPNSCTATLQVGRARARARVCVCVCARARACACAGRVTACVYTPLMVPAAHDYLPLCNT
jgi:hypothetical protein